MEIKVNVGELVAAKGAFDQLFAAKWPVKLSYRLAKLGGEINAKYKAVSEAQKALIEKHGEKNERGQPAVMQVIKDPEDREGKKTIPNPAWAAYQKEWAELLATEESIEIGEGKIKLPEKVAATCDKCHHNMDKAYEVEPALLMALEKFVEVA